MAGACDCGHELTGSHKTHVFVCLLSEGQLALSGRTLVYGISCCQLEKNSHFFSFGFFLTFATHFGIYAARIRTLV